ncbi:rRNA maturation RNase YbeY [Psychrobacter jeotgali]|uniref:rRNA maturation RNase YbeY n=1 Tax=Psychrobacter jeotgali TaxID=179010 RepID=UPI00191B637B|nr:rRNA maturation RNase YbeY [Psychrobacter jeotgali]
MEHSNNQAELDISAIDSLDGQLLDELYNQQRIMPVLTATLAYIEQRINNGLTLPYFADIDSDFWQSKPKSLALYITDDSEGRELNLAARAKDYATNILSYPSELPASVLELMPTLPLGELIICHQVVIREAAEQDKTSAQHLTHLVIHGVLHLLGFDHEIGQLEQDEMEGFEIDILADLGLPNPYL